MGLKPHFPNFVLKPFAQGLKFLFRRLGAAAVQRNHIGEEEGPQQNREKGYGAHADSVAEADLKRFNGAGFAATACMGRYQAVPVIRPRTCRDRVTPPPPRPLVLSMPATTQWSPLALA